MHPALRKIDHRPWPLPRRRWIWRQSWRELLFAHWPIEASLLRPLVPNELQVQEFEGVSWIGVVPFRMAGVMRRPWPDLPYISAFPELNVRIYVERAGKPGVWFFSLDAANPLAVWAARRFFHLPYFHADMQVQAAADGVHYSSRRRNSPTNEAFAARYQPTSDVFQAAPGTLDHWLTERYCLYAQAPTGALYRCEVHHVPWPLQHAVAEITGNTLCDAYAGINLAEPPTLLHFAKRVDVVAWRPELIDC